MMSFKIVALNTRIQTYDKTPKKKYEGASFDKTSLVNPSHTSPSNGPLTIKKT